MDGSTWRLRVGAFVVVLATVGLGLQAPAHAADAPVADPASLTEDPITDPPVPALEDQPSQYVLADSTAEAAAILDALASGGSASINAASVQYGPCVLYPSVVYLRASSGYGAVGAKPYTKCSVAVTSIHHETTLKYKWALWWRSKGPYTGTNYGAASYTSYNVEYWCKSSESTTWAGTTWGSILYRGNTYYARVYQGQQQLKCGA
ncbi:hypothetical protein GCM10011584_33080 [Nocardioides phosphati]|uniref:Uncharacterized protein n=1 Tax=Nocardioides phosphati TaxID=1867775 RepID=A0ABQ2NJ90_9ACTN|nr:hypothetical protein [Nocardioides phosphati]GGO93724.1 hypothetical protein GCM10011584_33080 [Nocardioides phosphati]